jgi:hypothetical protein
MLTRRIRVADWLFLDSVSLAIFSFCHLPILLIYPSDWLTPARRQVLKASTRRRRGCWLL